MSNRPDPRPALRYPLVVNGLDYLLDVVGRLATEPGTVPDARALKYAVLHLQAGTEVLLKARLQQEHWSLVFDEPATASRAKFDRADFTSCTTTAAFTRLTNIVGLDLPQKGIDAVTKLARDRNALMHYGLTQSAGAVEARAADVLNFLLPFLTTHLLPGLEPEHKADAEQTLTVVRAQLRGIEAYVKTRMNDLRAGLAKVADTTVVCPQCAQPALVLAAGESPACRFCLKTWPEPDASLKAAAEYSWIVLGQESDSYPTPDSFIQWCPDCPALSLTLVMGAVTAVSTQRRLCFGCAGDFTHRELIPCPACGALTPSDAEAAKCSACLEYGPDFAIIRTASEESAS